ncbi:immunoglobulin-binding protein 1 [Cyprinodon tularosa]|uniref:immunoglobulin-binding protein 1 n=1 Tax=Cyprinodon tularosa TaxID=77115 RepID=UPI0018E26C96|nr:immunoglobulin-binding protein 1 [Cyprinodon tularosa]
MADSASSIPPGQLAAPEGEQLKLSELLDRGWKILEELDNSTEPFGPETIRRVQRGVSLLEQAAGMVAQLELFSRNEELEEVSTADLKYLLLPALLGALRLKHSGQQQRLETLRAARLCFMDFLKKCQDYNVCQFQLPSAANGLSEGGAPPAQSSSAGPPSLVAMAAKRQSKIERYRQRKELEARLSDVRRLVESGQADDEASREFYLLNIQRWVGVSLEEMESIDQELEILQNMDALKQSSAHPAAQPSRRPMKPFVLTRDAVQARVLGAGYPSLPTMTVDDWYEQHRRQGALPDQGVARRVPGEEDVDAQERDEEEKEKQAANDDPAALLKARNWDEWKDEHRRGYGNRQNMG